LLDVHERVQNCGVDKRLLRTNHDAWIAIWHFLFGTWLRPMSCAKSKEVIPDMNSLIQNTPLCSSAKKAGWSRVDEEKFIGKQNIAHHSFGASEHQWELSSSLLSLFDVHVWGILVCLHYI
jgi:hypothetical protein